MDKINFRGKRILVTGGNGFLGSKLVFALKQSEADVYVIDHKVRNDQKSFNIDITDKKKLIEVVQNVKPDIVFHLAASLNRKRDVENYDENIEVNIVGTKNLLEALKSVDYDKLIFTSTSEVYGNNNSPYNEKMLPAPVSPYSVSKYSAETVIRTISELYNKNYIILRLFNFYGEGMSKEFFIPSIVHAMKHEKEFNMTKGDQTRDFLHVDDVIQSLMLAANSPEANNEVFNVCSGKETSLKELVTACKEGIKSSCKVNFGALPYRDKEVWSMVGDNSKIVNKLGFKVTKPVSSFFQESVNQVEYE